MTEEFNLDDTVLQTDVKKFKMYSSPKLRLAYYKKLKLPDYQIKNLLEVYEDFNNFEKRLIKETHPADTYSKDLIP